MVAQGVDDGAKVFSAENHAERDGGEAELLHDGREEKQGGVASAAEERVCHSEWEGFAEKRFAAGAAVGF
jgi:hypothetical protein